MVLGINGGSGGGGGGGGPLTFNPGSLAFSAPVGTNPATQVVSVNANAQTSFSAITNQTWLAVSPASGTTFTNVTVVVNSSSLPAGSYNGTITFTANGTTQNVPVNLTVVRWGGAAAERYGDPGSRPDLHRAKPEAVTCRFSRFRSIAPRAPRLSPSRCKLPQPRAAPGFPPAPTAA